MNGKFCVKLSISYTSMSLILQFLWLDKTLELNRNWPELNQIKQFFRPCLQTSASLKFTVLNPKGWIWTMVAGGGASIIHADTVSSLSFAFSCAWKFNFLHLSIFCFSFTCYFTSWGWGSWLCLQARELCRIQWCSQRRGGLAVCQSCYRCEHHLVA